MYMDAYWSFIQDEKKIGQNLRSYQNKTAVTLEIIILA